MKEIIKPDNGNLETTVSDHEAWAVWFVDSLPAKGWWKEIWSVNTSSVVFVWYLNNSLRQGFYFPLKQQKLARYEM